MKTYSWIAVFLFAVVSLAPTLALGEQDTAGLVDFRALTKILPSRDKEEGVRYSHNEVKAVPLSDEELSKIEGQNRPLTDLPIILVPGTLLYSATQVFLRVKSAR